MGSSNDSHLRAEITTNASSNTIATHQTNMSDVSSTMSHEHSTVVVMPSMTTQSSLLSSNIDGMNAIVTHSDAMPSATDMSNMMSTQSMADVTTVVVSMGEATERTPSVDVAAMSSVSTVEMTIPIAGTSAPVRTETDQQISDTNATVSMGAHAMESTPSVTNADTIMTTVMPVVTVTELNFAGVTNKTDNAAAGTSVELSTMPSPATTSEPIVSRMTTSLDPANEQSDTEPIPMMMMASTTADRPGSTVAITKASIMNRPTVQRPIEISADDELVDDPMRTTPMTTATVPAMANTEKRKNKPAAGGDAARMSLSVCTVVIGVTVAWMLA